jgi:hypothetical protein
MHMLHVVVMVEEIWWRENVAHVIKLIRSNQINMNKSINNNLIICESKKIDKNKLRKHV